VSDVIQRLLEVEKDARRILTEAEQQAAAMLSRANEEARSARAEARDKGRRDADEFVKQKTEELQERYAARVEAAKAQLPSPGNLDPDEVREAARYVVNVVSGLEAGQ
jgi:vacuolar-type H+-ATPase subunit H